MDAEGNVRAKVVEAICEIIVEDKPLADENNLELDLGMDWLDKIEMIMIIEEELGIAINDEKADEMKTVGDVVKVVKEEVERRQAEQEAV